LPPFQLEQNRQFYSKRIPRPELSTKWLLDADSRVLRPNDALSGETRPAVPAGGAAGEMSASGCLALAIAELTIPAEVSTRADHSRDTPVEECVVAYPEIGQSAAPLKSSWPPSGG
jgi:hypothetical protein